VERTISFVRMRSSSCVIRFVTTEGATLSSRAAAEKLPTRATTRKALMFCSVLMAVCSLSQKADRAFCSVLLRVTG
jgi:hypothetical protein